MSFIAGEGKMKPILNSLFKAFLVICSISLAACNLPSGPQITETVSVLPTAEPVSATEEVIALQEPEAGSLMLWVDGSYVVYVPQGDFVMGKDETTPSDHAPAHTISLDGFWIHQTEVTNGMYATCVALGICTAPAVETGSPNRYADARYTNAPVGSVDWDQAEAYCEWIEGRLPTEAEWEKAARGTEAATYPWGETDPACDLLNYSGCLPTPAPEIIRTYPLGASPYNLADTAGNVSEWVYDWYASDYYPASPADSPSGPATGEKRVVRGSNYLTPVEDLEIVLRDSLKPDKHAADLGFRCILAGEQLSNQTPHAPACNVLSYNLIIPASQWPQQEPVTPPGAAVQSYCIEVNGNQIGTCVVKLDQGIDPGEVTISSPNGTLNCTQDVNETQKFACAGTALIPGQTTILDVCKNPGPGLLAEAPVCPVFYTFIPNTGMCEYGTMMPVNCPAPNVAVAGYGCLPAPQNDECPLGSYSATYQGDPVCVPAGGPKCQGLLCQATCPPGLVFNQGNFCCDYPTSMPPTCNPGYTYVENVHLCLPDPPIQSGCTTLTTNVPTCPTDVPPDTGGTGCWVYPATTAPYWADPCP
jgi:formylglycine-generating enzyme required for sulfatase activity